MVKLFLDTNIWVTFLTGRNEDDFEAVSKLMDKIRLGRITPYTSGYVMSEVYYVMTALYKADKVSLVEDIRKLLRLRNIVTIDKFDIETALSHLIESRIKLSDCIITTQIPSGVKLCTFDRDFRKFPFLEIVTPNEIISSS